MVLNQMLYDLLNARLGRVTVSNEGDPMQFSYNTGGYGGRPGIDIASWGESYGVSCPFCSDTRRRLSINHRYGVYDPVTGSDNLTLARCFNEDCLKGPGRVRELRELVFGFLNRDQRRQLSRQGCVARQSAQPTGLATARPPGDVTDLRDLPADHRAVAYLRGRGFDPGQLAESWQVGYCTRAEQDFALAQGRLVAPIVQGGVAAGWQARYVGEHSKEMPWPKYYTMPGLPKRWLLYNHDRALRQPLVVVCEGVTDVWRVGEAGVALLGKTASRQQFNLLVRGWARKPIVLLLDGDAGESTDRLDLALRPYAKAGLARVTLPDGRDPGGYGHDELWHTIREQAARQGVALPSVSPAASGSECDAAADPSAAPSGPDLASQLTLVPSDGRP